MVENGQVAPPGGVTTYRWYAGDIEYVDLGSFEYEIVATHKGKESRYDRLMRRIIKEGVKTRVLMLSATPVNNRLADLRNSGSTGGTELLEYTSHTFGLNKRWGWLEWIEE